MRIAGVLIGVVVAVMGLVWALQGVNSTLVPQSFMTGSGVWVVIGLFTFALGAALTVWSWRRPS